VLADAASKAVETGVAGVIIGRNSSGGVAPAADLRGGSALRALRVALRALRAAASRRGGRRQPHRRRTARLAITACAARAQRKSAAAGGGVAHYAQPPGSANLSAAWRRWRTRCGMRNITAHCAQQTGVASAGGLVLAAPATRHLHPAGRISWTALISDIKTTNGGLGTLWRASDARSA